MTGMIHPAWCVGIAPVCTATASAGEHRGELVEVAVADPDLVAGVRLQLAQPVAVGGGTPRLDLVIGADRFTLPRDSAWSLADQIVALVRRTDDAGAYADLPSQRGASA